MVTTSFGVVYRKMQAHLKPYTPQNKKVTIYPVFVTTDGTIRPYVASETILPQEIFKSEQSITSTYKHN